MKKKQLTDILVLVISMILLVVTTLYIRIWITLPIILILDIIWFKFNIKIRKDKKGKMHLKLTPRPKKKKEKNTFIKVVVLACLTFCAFVLLSGIAFLSYIIITTDDFDPNKLHENDATIVYDSKGKVIATLGAQNREKITYEDLSEEFVNALIATEDSRFFQHNGFDLPRFLKASLGQIMGRDSGGASTLTMQVSKNNYTSSEAVGIGGIVRKFRDIYISIFQIEKKYTKKEILEFYVNDPWLGSVAYGVEQAAQIYFNKSISDVNLAEAAMIAGIFNAPGSLDPFLNPENCEARRKVVLSLMERHGYITSEERAIANEMTVDKLLVTGEEETETYGAFIDTLVQDVINETELDPYTTPMEIYSTMDTDMQKEINDVMDGTDFKWENDEIQGAAVITDVNTGAIVAVAAGRNRVQRGYNFATMINRQIGSTAKPLYDYGPAFEFLNWSTYHPLVDEKYGYSTGGNLYNYDGKYKGLITLRYALADSRNVTALKTFQSLKASDVTSFVKSLGLHPETPLHEAHAIGGYNGENPRSMSSAYAAFANGGYYNESHTFTKIVFREGDRDDYVCKPKKTSVMSKATAYMMTSVLKSQADLNLKTFFNKALYGSKTGSTNYDGATLKKHKLPSNAVSDRWVCAINTKYSIGLWYGYRSLPDPDATVKHYLTMLNKKHANFFAAIASKVFTGRTDWEKPDDVVQLEIEKESYPEMLASEFTPSNMITKELYKVGTEPSEVSERYSQLDNVTNLNTSVDKNEVTLSWDPIKTPDAINPTYLKSYFANLYKSTTDQDKYYNARIAYNSSTIGTVGYNVYVKNDDGSLNLLGFTSTNSYSYTATTNSVTFVVKTVYSIFKSNISSGTEITANLTGVVSPVTVSLNGSKNVEINVNETYVDYNPPIIVLENLVDITDSVVITTRIIKQSTNSEVTTITSTTPDTFIITYSVNYNGTNHSLTRTVHVV